MRKVRKQFFLYTKVLALLVLSLLLLAGCGAEKNMKKAEKFMTIGEYYDAASQYKQAYSKTPPKERDRRGLIAGKMAVCYRKINSTPKAVAAYRNMVRYNKATVDDRLELGRQLLKNGDYKQAAEQFRVVLDSMPDNVLARNGLLSAQQAPAWKKQGSRYTVKRMDVFNSRRAEYSPMLSGDQFDQLYFSSTRNDATGDELSGITGTKNGDIFVSQKDDKGKWSKPEVVNGGLNTEADEGASCLSPDQREMYLTQCVTDPSYPRYAQIVKSNRSDAAWGKASSVELTKDTLSCFAHPAVSPDGQWLYFVSDMPGGKGGLDIWRVRITSAGYGGVKNRGFFSSNRGDGRGWDHIYSFVNPEIVQSVKGWVYEQEGYELPAAQVYMIGSDGTNLKLGVKSDGSFEKELTPGVEYMFLATCKGFLNHKEELKVVPMNDSHEYVLQFPLASITAPVLIDNIFYDFNKATLRPESQTALDELVKLLNENPNVTIELSSHCDYKGSSAYNKLLAQRRAESVVNYLVDKGIARDRLSPVGYGKEKPKTIRKKLTEKLTWLKEGDVLTEEFIKKLDPEKQEICNQLNRRTEFIVLRTTYGLLDENGQLKPKAKTAKPSSTKAKDADNDFDVFVE